MRDLRLDQGPSIEIAGAIGLRVEQGGEICEVADADNHDIAAGTRGKQAAVKSSRFDLFVLLLKVLRKRLRHFAGIRAVLPDAALPGDKADRDVRPAIKCIDRIHTGRGPFVVSRHHDPEQIHLAPVGHHVELGKRGDVIDIRIHVGVEDDRQRGRHRAGSKKSEKQGTQEVHGEIPPRVARERQADIQHGLSAGAAS